MHRVGAARDRVPGSRFGKDFLIDLVGYRRHGHNETDEPAFTQPVLYAQIKTHPTPREVWGRRLVAEGVISAEEVKRSTPRSQRAVRDDSRRRLKAKPATRCRGAPAPMRDSGSRR